MNWIGMLLGWAADPRLDVMGPQPTVIGPRAPMVLTPLPRFAWDEKRWRRIRDEAETHYVGSYRVRDGAQKAWREFEGRLVQNRSGIEAFVADPPEAIKRHPKGPCFQLVRRPWFRVHWHRTPASIDEALIYVEQLLDECVNSQLGCQQ